MATKEEVIQQLSEAGIAHDPSAKVADLKALLPNAAPDAAPAEAPATAAVPAEAPAAAPAASSDDIEVNDPLVLRPVDLPLVVKPAAGLDWKNPEQAEYAKILNAAAYANKNWPLVKDAEIARLKEIGNDPSRFYFYTGSQPMEKNLQYNNKLID